MLFGYVFLYAPIALLAIVIMIYFQDLGFKLILLAVATWFLGFWLIPEIMEKPRSLIFVTPEDTDVSVRSAFAALEGILAVALFLVGKVRNWVP